MPDSTYAKLTNAEKTRQLVTARLKEKGISLRHTETIARRPIDSPSPASFAQQRLWLLEQISPGSRYNMQVVLHLRGVLHIQSLNSAWRELLKRHEILRTTFGVADDQIMQFISTEPGSSMAVFDLTEENPSEREPRLRHLIEKQGQDAFDLAHGPLVRPAAFKLGREEYILSLAMHHIVSDGWSMVVLVRELTELYIACKEGRLDPLPPLAIQYADFAYWQRQRLSGDFLEKQLNYWRKQLSNASVLELPTDHPHSGQEIYRGSRCDFRIGEETAERLRGLARRNHASLFMVMLAAWQVLLYRYSGQSDIVVGAPIANRTHVQIETLIGFFVNTLVLRTDMSGNPDFKEALSRTRKSTLDAYEHQDVPYEKLVAELRPERAASQTPFFGIMLNWINMPESAPDLAGMLWESVPLENPTAKFDLTLNIVERSGALPASLEYSTDLYEQATIVRMAEHLQNLLAGIAIDADQSVAELPILGEDERSQVLFLWNQTERRYAACETLLELLELQARTEPDHPAVVFEGTTLSYRELHRQANQLAHYLRKQGVGPEVLVGVCMERSAQLVIALLGILKAGGAYVPLDPSHPSDRLNYILRDAQVGVLIADSGSAEKLHGVGARVVCLEEQWKTIGAESQEAVASLVGGENLAYVIYTSGSTGHPKGVMSLHRGLLNRLQWMQDAYGQEKQERVLQKTPFGFDVSVWEFFWPLLYGGCVVVARADGHKDSGYLVRTIQQEKITTLHFVPSMLQVFLQEADLEKCTSLRRVISSGEALTVNLVEQFQKRLPVELHNLYGPTEASIEVSFWACRGTHERGSVPIGRPIANTQLYVLDRHLQPVPVGVTGELYIGGTGLARGYRRRADLTAEKFIPDPFSPRAGERLYRTGDLARRQSDGAMEYVGRSDHQIKLRGFRIELGEIEAVLERHEAVQQAVVALQEDDGREKKLIAYVVPAGDGRLPTAALRSYLQEKLPEYMTPSAFMELPSLPLSVNGKVNRKALPRWEFKIAEAEGVNPRTPTEELLAGIWSDVLGVERIGRHDNFFELGGHSLSAMQTTSRVRSALQVELPFSGIFETPTVRGLAARIEQSRREQSGQALPPLVSRDRSGPQPLSFAQMRLWFMDRLHPNSTFYNISGAARLSGELDCAALAQAVLAVGDRHEVLRTRFAMKEEGPVQIIEKDARLILRSEDLRAFKPEDRENTRRERIEEESRRPFALSRCPLARVMLLRTDEQEYVLLISMHHIVSDGWSIHVLMRELTEMYAAFSRGQLSSLPPPVVQYADYAQWQREYLQGAVLEKQLSYWRNRLSNAPAPELPTDRPRPTQESFRGAFYRYPIPLELAAGLRSLARSRQSTLFMVLLAAWQTLLYRYSGQADFTVGMPVANRSLPETEGLIGFFVNTIVLRSDLNGDLTFTEALQRTRKTVLEAFDHQDIPFEKLVADLRPDRNPGQTPLFRVMFNWVNTPAADLNFSGIRWEPIAQQHSTANFDLTFTAGEQEGALPAGFEYSTDLYDEPTIAQMAGHLLVVLRAAVDSPQCPLATMPLLTESERERLLFEWNRTAADFGQAMCVHELIELQARSAPDAVAIAADDEAITYGELNQRAGQVARRLQSRGVSAEVRVGVCLPGSPQMLVVLLGILKAGGAYVPLDPAYPPARLRYMVEDSGLKLLITETGLGEQFAQLPVECLYLDSLGAEPTGSHASFRETTMPDNAAYIIYTSGSTGRSKGVVARHSSVTNQVQWMKTAFGLTSSDRVIHKASISFDASVAEIFGPLAAGAQLIVTRPGAQNDVDYLVQVMKTRQITFIDLSPTLLRALLEHPEIRQCSALRQVVSGGEALATDLESQTLKVLKAQLYNTYGPTESTVQSTFHACSAAPHGSSVPIGRPIANTTVYALDFNGQPVPVGAEGELCIAGAGLARGYLNRPALTAEQFVPNPFSAEPGERMYKTGDRVRWRRDGALEFTGRTDQQMKVHGFRIEPGEIESALLAHPKVREAAAIARENGSAGKQIAAFVVTDKDSPPDIHELRQHVKDILPFYMRPALYVLMEQLPLNANGKVDRSALAAIEPGEETHKDIPPRTATEKVLCKLWAEILNREEVGVEDDFFASGGHSFLAVNLISRITRSFGRDLALDTIFQHPTPREMARLIDQGAKDTGTSGVICMNKGTAELPPLYLMYPVGGNVLCYSDLARIFPRGKPFYAMQAPAADQLKHATLEAIAAYHLQFIQRRDRGGGYELGGWSFGGMLAFEMAQQAALAGDPPAALYLLDPPVIENLPSETPCDEEIASLFVLTLIGDFTGGKPLDLDELKKEFGPRDRSLEAQLRKAAEFGLLPAGTDAAMHAQSFEVFKRNMLSAQMYRPQKYSGQTMLVLPDTRHSEIWPTLLPDNSAIVRVPGNHFTMLRGSSAAKIAGLIESGGSELSP